MKEDGFERGPLSSNMFKFAPVAQQPTEQLRQIVYTPHAKTQLPVA